MDSATQMLELPTTTTEDSKELHDAHYRIKLLQAELEDVHALHDHIKTSLTATEEQLAEARNQILESAKSVRASSLSTEDDRRRREAERALHVAKTEAANLRALLETSQESLQHVTGERDELEIALATANNNLVDASEANPLLPRVKELLTALQQERMARTAHQSSSTLLIAGAQTMKARIELLEQENADQAVESEATFGSLLERVRITHDSMSAALLDSAKKEQDLRGQLLITARESARANIEASASSAEVTSLRHAIGILCI